MDAFIDDPLVNLATIDRRSVFRVIRIGDRHDAVRRQRCNSARPSLSLSAGRRPLLTEAADSPRFPVARGRAQGASGQEINNGISLCPAASTLPNLALCLECTREEAADHGLSAGRTSYDALLQRGRDPIAVNQPPAAVITPLLFRSFEQDKECGANDTQRHGAEEAD